jgi:UDP-N-acetylmuramoyl-tripeptide--D-alanyl-D-alanine ligase
VRFGNDPQADMVLGELVTTADGLRFTVNSADRVKLPLLGAHNAMNGLAAIAVGRRLGLSVAEAAARLADFAPPPMRLQRMQVGGIDVINDAYNANPASMAAALDVFSDIPCRGGSPGSRGGRGGRKTFICGDMLELGPNSEPFHYQLGQRIAGTGVSRLIAVGKFSEAVVRGACQAGLDESATARFATTEALVERLGELLRPGDLVLLKGSRGVALERVLDALKRNAVEK